MVKARQLFPFAILAFLAVSPAFVPADEGLTITVTDLRNNRGHVLISLFRGAEGFPNKPAKAFRKEKVSITNGQALTVFTGLPSGNYAIAILHDENDDQKMNTNALGIPKEGYGFSNNVTGTLGPPSYNRAKFSVKTGKGLVVEIKARY